MQSVPQERLTHRIERSLLAALVGVRSGSTCPPLLYEAMQYAVFPGGSRMRPQLCLLAAEIEGDDAPDLTDAMATALELVHCASLVHDDMPCFDDADTRRGNPSVHRAYGSAQALLVGDALIVLAFDVMSRAALESDRMYRAVRLSSVLARAVGARNGIIAGQAWELEPQAPLTAYHRQKTGSLFEAATLGGAIAAGSPHEAAWARVGASLGAAYQVVDDIVDATSDEARAGKPVGRDVALDRPSVVRELGLDAARSRLRAHIDEAATCLPAGSRAAERLGAWIRSAVEPRIASPVAA